MAKLTTKQEQILKHIQAGKTNAEIARETGFNPATIRKVRSNHADLIEQAASVASVNVDNWERDLTKTLKQLTLFLANTLASKNMKTQSAPQLMTALAVAFDKLRLLEGKATSITQTSVHDLSDKQREILQELSDKYTDDLKARLRRVK